MRKITVTRFEKTARETLDYDFIFDDWLASKPGATVTGFEVFSTAGITVAASVRTGGVVKVFISGGESGSDYDVSVLLTATLSGNTLKRELAAQLSII